MDSSMKYKRDLDMSKFRQTDSEGSVVKNAAKAIGYAIIILVVFGYLLHRIDLSGHWTALPF